MSYVPAPGYRPSYNPTLPYNSPIPGGLQPGMSVYIQGNADEKMKRFCVNFKAGSGSEADIAFHFNPRFDGWDKVVFNSFQGGRWCNEEKKRSMPFHRGSHFELVFLVTNEHYKVVVNGNPFYEFGHRLPPQMVTHLHVDGDLSLQSINFIGGKEPGSSMPPAYPGAGVQSPPSSLPSMGGPPVFNPSTPYRGHLNGGLSARSTIVVKGFVPTTAESFIINLKEGESDDVALHINPRLLSGSIVRNSFLKGKWGKEEVKVAFNPFARGHYFDLSIRCGMDRFKVYANGDHVFDFTHRLSAFQKINTLEIQGDVKLSYVQI
ncbi:galectin-4 [Ornithorhynchus anatinus]|nr:galectin-4 [Ornithorhynchus anatinus]